MKKEPLYVSRKIINSSEIINWYKNQGIQGLPESNELHITQVYSSEPVDLDAMTYDTQNIIVKKEDADAKMECFGDGKYLVLAINVPEMQKRFEYFQSQGCSFDFPNYQPHTTISNNFSNPPSMEEIIPFDKDIILGPEISESLQLEEIKKYDIKATPQNLEAIMQHPNAIYYNESLLEDIDVSFIIKTSQFDESYYIKKNDVVTPINSVEYDDFISKYNDLLKIKITCVLEIPANKITVECQNRKWNTIILETASPGSLNEHIPEIQNKDISLHKNEEKSTELKFE